MWVIGTWLIERSDLQQTPANNPKVMLKIFAQPAGASAPETHVFSFTSAISARAEADAIKGALGKAIQAVKAGNSTPSRNGDAASAAMAIAGVMSTKTGTGNDVNSWYDDDKLKTDIELQQSLLKVNPSLSQIFMESLRTKPESISNSQFTAQFWSTRTYLLRAHAIERSQTRGSYNVLSTIKPRTEDNAIKLSISKEQIQLIFSQHSLVKRVYDENVPKLSEEAFWSRFFQSRLFKKLKGEKISEADPSDPILDKYLNQDDDPERTQRLLDAYIPHIIDIEGNEENHSQRKGNQPDLTMRPTSVDRVPIIRTLNSLSEKIMSHVAPNDVEPSAPIGMDEETFNSLALQDLQGDAEENRIILNIKDQNRFFSSHKDNDASDEALQYSKQDSSKVLRMLQDELHGASSGVELKVAIGVNDESSESESEDTHAHDHIGSKSSLRKATTHILSAITQQRSLNDDLHDSNSSLASTCDLPQAIFDRLLLTHATTTEFLHHFWLAFLSGDPSRTDEIARLVETLDRAMDRIQAVAADAEAERMKEVEKLKRQVLQHFKQTNRKLAFHPDSIKGGTKAVNQLMRPTVQAIAAALEKYNMALGEEGSEA